MNKMKNQCIQLFMTLALFQLVHGHGYMMNPPARNVMWRYGFKTPVNYNFNQLWCGGRQKYVQKNGCGICGDAIDGIQYHGNGGRYDTGAIAQSYRRGQTISVDVQLTAAHRGYFEFRIASLDYQQAKGDRNGKLSGQLLRTVYGSEKVTVPSYRPGKYSAKLRLPYNLRCKRCILQWWYKTGNNWGCDRSGCGMGRGNNQERFANCADVRIS